MGSLTELDSPGRLQTDPGSTVRSLCCLEESQVMFPKFPRELSCSPGDTLRVEKGSIEL